MQYADAVGQLKGISERQIVRIRLHHMHVRKVVRVLEGGLHRIRKVNSDDLLRLELRTQEYMPSLPATNVQHCSSGESTWIKGLDPVQEFLPIRIRQRRVVGPLIAERSGGSLLRGRQGWRQESRDAANDGKVCSASRALGRPFYDLVSYLALGSDVEQAPAAWARQK